MGRILALDYGTKRTGIAVSDPSGIIAGGLDTVETPQVVEFLKKYVAENGVKTIVLGKPSRMDGTPSETFPAIEKLREKLEKEFPGVRFDYCDERFTSVLAQRAMIDGGMKKKDRRDKGTVDRISATIILQSYLESKK